MKNRRHCTWLFALLPVLGAAQIHVDKPVILNGANEVDRQLTGMPISSAPGDVLTAAVEQSGELYFAPEVAGNDWAAVLPGLVESVSAGLHVVLRTPVTISGPVTMMVNGQGPFPVVRGTEAVDGGRLDPGMMLSLVFDGNAMQVINGRNDALRACPIGTVAVNDQFCIEPTQRPAADFFTAAVTCASTGRRLCSWGEFHVACVNTGPLGLSNMEDMWEWSNNAANEDNTVRVVGQGTCFSAGTWPATGSAPIQYRCCYSR